MAFAHAVKLFLELKSLVLILHSWLFRNRSARALATDSSQPAALARDWLLYEGSDKLQVRPSLTRFEVALLSFLGAKPAKPWPFT